MPNLSARYDEILGSSDPLKAIKDHSFYGLDEPESENFYSGKVRDLLIRENEIEMVHSDRLTAFDRFISLIPYKGIVLSELSYFWLQGASKFGPTHLIKKIDERRLLLSKCEPIKAEVVVRGYLAGSMARAYTNGEREFCGNVLSENLQPHQRLPEPIITPSTKAAAFDHDEPTTKEAIIESGVATAEEWSQIEDYTHKIFAWGSQLCLEQGWILVDTKYEFGRSQQGEIVLIDEVHTPDSSRFWRAKTYDQKFNAGETPDMFDKEIIRGWLLNKDYSGEGTPPEVPAELLIKAARSYLELAQSFVPELT